MSKHAIDCECEVCFRREVISAVDRGIKKRSEENPGRVCPFCGTNPSEPAKYGSGWKDYCGHEVRKYGLVIGWTDKSIKMKCNNSAETRQLVYVGGKWREDEV